MIYWQRFAFEIHGCCYDDCGYNHIDGYSVSNLLQISFDLGDNAQSYK